MINVLEYLEQTAARLPGKTAFADPEDAVTWAELLHESRCVAAALAGAEAIAPRTPVPVFLEKSVNAIRAFMGIVTAGCFYAQLDVRQPAARLGQILEKLNAPAVITDSAHLQKLLETGYGGKLLLIDSLLLAEPDDALLQRIRAQAVDLDPLYCNFTSGSTGTPKGVLVPHRPVIDFIEQFTEIFRITEDDVIGNQAPFDFDVSVKDIYSALKTGATVRIIPTRYFSVPVELLDYLTAHHVTTLIWAVSAVCLLSQLHGFDYKVPADVRKVIFSGEVMPVRQLNIWKEVLPDALYANVYGPTEITCNCTYYIVDRQFAPGENLPIGQPFPNEKVFLLDEQDRLITEPDVTGEICVSGSCLALGYYRDPEMTSRVFTQNPLQSDYPERIYRTGDLAYYDARGVLFFASRRDFQIKHMGHRIELGEIEAALEKLPKIERACCLYLRGKIVAFYLGSQEKKQLAHQLADALPQYMMPNVWVPCETFPLTKNAKIDRAALEAAYQNRRKQRA
ncbi:MAG: amino acid adenylation domain-containing protein [Eubacterium sp.]|nr:amino acid adenylation domain-containing protein [Eubacterium sp.]